MSLRRKLIFGLVSLICFCLGVTATVIFSPGRTFRSALPQPRPARYGEYRGGSWRSCGVSQEADEILANQVSIFETNDLATIDEYRREAEQLESKGRARLGICMQDVSGGIEVRGLKEGYPAEAAGLRRGDVITAVNGLTVTYSTRLIRYLLVVDPSAQVRVTFERDGDTMTASFYPVSIPVEGMPLTHRALGRAYAAIGAKQSAIDQYNKYLSEDSDPSDRSWIEGQMERLR